MNKYFYLKKPKITIPKEKFTSRIFTFGLIDKKWFQSKRIIACYQKAKSCEFQFNMSTLQIQLKSIDRRFRIYIVLPVSIYNYPQQVSVSYIDFNLLDVEESAKAIKKESKQLADQIASLLSPLKKMTTMFTISFKFIEDGGSIHRHPGRFGFSSIDLDNDPTNPGVIFRKAKAKEFVQLDSIMVWENSEFDLFTSESRYLALKKAKDGGVKGGYFENPTLIVYKNVSNYLKYFGKSENYNLLYKHQFAEKVVNTPVGSLIIEILKNLDYEPIYNVNPDNIESRFKNFYENSNLDSGMDIFDNRDFSSFLKSNEGGKIW